MVRAQLFPRLGGQRAGISALTFLKIDVSPRSVGMGGAQLSTEGDIYATYWNPAATTDLQHTTFAASNTFWAAGINHAYASFLRPDEKIGNFGLSVTSLSTGKMPVRTEYQPNGTGQYFYASNTAVAVTYSRKLTDMFSYGATFKYVNEQLAEFMAHTVLVDFGFKYQTDFKKLAFAVVMQNFGTNSRLKESKNSERLVGPSDISLESYPPPTLFRIGVSVVPYETDNMSLTVALQLNHPNDNAENIRIGAEFEWRKLLYVRAGYKINVKDQTYPTGGVGIRTRIGRHPLMVDYAVDPTRYLGIIHRVGLSFSLNKVKREGGENVQN